MLLQSLSNLNVKYFSFINYHYQCSHLYYMTQNAISFMSSQIVRIWIKMYTNDIPEKHW